MGGSMRKEGKVKEVEPLISIEGEKGFLTFEEVNEIPSNDIVSSDQIDDVLMMFDEMDIDVVDDLQGLKMEEEKDLEKEEEEDSHLGDFIEDKAILSPQEAVISANLTEQTGKVLSSLTSREEKVLRMRFGIGEKYDHTLEEVGQDFDVTRERIQQIEAKALRKLRHPSRSKRLKSFIEA